jgi:hypothetical protein
MVEKATIAGHRINGHGSFVPSPDRSPISMGCRVYAGIK